MSARDVIAWTMKSLGAFDPTREADAVLVALHAADYRILGPGELDVKTMEKCAQMAEKAGKPAVTEVASQPTIHAMFETVDPSVPVTGTTAAPIKRIEQNDDGSYTVVIDHWPRKGGADHA